MTGGAGVVILDEDDNTVAQTDAARHWLADLVDVGVTGDRRLPAPVYAVAARARAIPSGDTDPASQARARAFTRSGRWLLLYAARLSGDREKLTSVVVEPAKPADVALLVLSAYGLSERECDIAQLVFAGRATNRIAERLHISPLTVQHYLKTVFEKAGVHSRRELVARLGWRDGAP